MRTVFIDLDNLNDTYYLGYTGEHLMTRVDLKVNEELAEATGFSLEFEVCGTKRVVSNLQAVNGIVSYTIPMDITGITNRKCSIALQLTGYLNEEVIGKSAVVKGWLEQGIGAVEADETLVPIATEVHQNTAFRHNHANKEVLDMFGLDEFNNLIWNEESLVPDLSTYAKKTEVPAIGDNVSLLYNDAGYLTEHQSLADYAKKTDIPTVPTNVSDFVNDAGYLTQHQSLADYATKTYVDTAIQGAIEGSY